MVPQVGSSRRFSIALALRKIGDQLFFKLRPVAAGDHGNLGHCRAGRQQRGHLRIQRRFAFGKGAVQIEHNQLLQNSLHLACLFDLKSKFRSLHCVICSAGERFCGTLCGMSSGRIPELITAALERMARLFRRGEPELRICAPAARARSWPTTFCAAKATPSLRATGAAKGRKGEIDLIGWDGNVLCFIEVKTRSSHAVMPAEAAVDRAKQANCAGWRHYFCSSRKPAPAAPVLMSSASIWYRERRRKLIFSKTPFLGVL